jgi:hypothetical protein
VIFPAGRSNLIPVVKGFAGKRLTFYAYSLLYRGG